MRTNLHQTHIAARVSHNTCSECRADTERRFAVRPIWRYQHVRDYLAYALLRLDAIKAGNNSAGARLWLQDFRKALHERIGQKVPAQPGRKYCASYLERLDGMRFHGRAARTKLI
jgi:hypothetical protein